MKNLLRAASLIQIMVAEFCVAMFLGGFIALQLARRAAPVQLTGFDWAFAALWAAVLVWLVRTMLFPAVTRDTFGRFSPGGPKDYDFSTTHPSYLLIDAITVIVAGFLFWITPFDSPVYAFEQARARVFGAFAVGFPLLRVLCWYVLRRRPAGKAVEEAWKPVLWFIGIFIMPVTVILLVSWYQVFILPYKNLPVVSAGSFTGGLTAHPELVDEEYPRNHSNDSRPTPVSKIVKLTGTLVSDAPSRCGAFGTGGDSFKFATARVDLGAGGEVLAFGNAFYREELVKRTTGFQGKTIVLYGRLRPLPERDAELCGLADLPPAPEGGRLLLVLENP